MTTLDANSLLDPETEFKEACRSLTQINSVYLTKVIIDGLWHAITSSTPSLLRNLIDYSSDILQTEEGGKLLWHVMNNGNIEMATILVHAGANLNVRKPDCSKKISFLHSLIKQIHDRDSKVYHQFGLLMIDKGADINARDFNGMSVLYYAIWYESFYFAKELIRRGALIDVYNEEQSTCVLLLALKKSDAKYLSELLVYSIKDEATRNERAMFIAEFYIDGNVDLKLIKDILDRGLPVDYTNSYGWTLLNRAIPWSRMDLIELLLEYGANVNKETNLGYCPLFLAVSLPETAVTTLLIKRGANIHAKNQDGEYSIHRACESQSAKNIQLLLRLGAEIKVTNANGETPFSLMNLESVTGAEFIVIRHLALLNSTGQKFYESDLLLIRMRRETERIYDNCLKEVENMKKTMIFSDISYICFFESTNELSKCVKNEEFVNNFKSKSNEISDSFPLYFSEMILKFEIVEKKEKLAYSTKLFVSGILSKFLPCIVTDKIAYYLYVDEWENFEINYYLQSEENL